jgi:hypothetical protein
MTKIIIVLLFLLFIMSVLVAVSASEDRRISSLESQKLILQTDISTLKARVTFQENRKNQIIDLLAPFAAFRHPENEIYMATRLYDELGMKLARVGMLVASREAGFNSTSVQLNSNGTWDKGCWQINDLYKLPDSVRLNCPAATEWTINKVKACGGTFCVWTAAKTLAREGKL